MNLALGLDQFGRVLLSLVRGNRLDWKAKYGGMTVPDLKRMKEMESELSQLKRMHADLALENRAMKELIEKSPEAAREKRGGPIHDGNAPFVENPHCRRVSLSRTASNRP